MVMREVVKNYCKQPPTAANKLPAEFSKDIERFNLSTISAHSSPEAPPETGVSKVHSILHTDASVLVLECKVQ